MRKASLLLAVAASAVGFATAGAQPAPTGSNAACSNTNVTTELTFGSPPKTGFPLGTADKSQIQCLTTDDATLVLTAVARFSALNPTPPPVVETFLGSGEYDASYGRSIPTPPTTFPDLAVWNFNFAVLGGTGGDSFVLFVDQDPTANTNFLKCVVGKVGDPCGLPRQESENLGFLPLDPSNAFDPEAPGTYTFQLEELNSDGRQVGSTLSINVNVIVSTPEPASIGLMATGLVGLAGFVRRRNKQNVA